MLSWQSCNVNNMLVLADDLTGAAESSGAILAVRPGSSVLHLERRPPRHDATRGLIVRDLNIRALPRSAARRVFRAALRRAGATPLFLKVDSLLRGSTADMVAELRRVGVQTVICVAHPARGRVVAEGVVRVDGVPLHHTRMWSAGDAEPPRSVAAAVGIVTEPVPRPDGATRSWEQLIEQRLEQTGVAICDAADDGDIAQIGRFITEAWAAGRPLVGMGAAPLARAIAAGSLASGASDPVPQSDPGAVLVVVGTNDPIAEVQIRRLRARGARHVSLRRGELMSRARRTRAARTITREASAAVCIVSIDGRSGWTDADLRRFTRVAADAVRAAGGAHLVLTGGSTARGVLDALKITRLRPITEAAGETMLCRTEDGRSVLTRPGSFGGPDGLIHAVSALPALFPLSPKE